MEKARKAMSGSGSEKISKESEDLKKHKTPCEQTDVIAFRDRRTRACSLATHMHKWALPFVVVVVVVAVAQTMSSVVAVWWQTSGACGLGNQTRWQWLGDWWWNFFFFRAGPRSVLHLSFEALPPTLHTRGSWTIQRMSFLRLFGNFWIFSISQ